MKIVLIRHGEPTNLACEPIYASGMGAWIDQYNSASIKPESHPGTEALAVASECNWIISSDLTRSIDSASSLYSGQAIEQMPCVFEAGLPYGNSNLIKAKPKTWAVLFRVLWYLGYTNNSESRSAVKVRSQEATTELIEKARKHEAVILVGHGIFNRFIAKELGLQGFVTTKRLGSRYWDFGIYERKST